MSIRTQIDEMITALTACEFIIEEDVAWVAITSDELRGIPAPVFFCPVRYVDCVKYRGIEFRVSQWARPGHRLYPVWNMTKRVKDMTFKLNSPQHKFKEIY